MLCVVRHLNTSASFVTFPWKNLKFGALSSIRVLFRDEQ